MGYPEENKQTVFVSAKDGLSIWREAGLKFSDSNAFIRKSDWCIAMKNVTTLKAHEGDVFNGDIFGFLCC